MSQFLVRLAVAGNRVHSDLPTGCPVFFLSFLLHPADAITRVRCYSAETSCTKHAKVTKKKQQTTSNRKQPAKPNTQQKPTGCPGADCIIEQRPDLREGGDDIAVARQLLTLQHFIADQQACYLPSCPGPSLSASSLVPVSQLPGSSCRQFVWPFSPGGVGFPSGLPGVPVRAKVTAWTWQSLRCPFSHQCNVSGVSPQAQDHVQNMPRIPRRNSKQQATKHNQQNRTHNTNHPQHIASKLKSSGKPKSRPVNH